ncbi:MAG: F-type H+-transporting ATPase subunit b [Pseudomonadota bacterium]|nr:F-type H+-transporting ATPase subunit b [Pseudomonadota bacterium]
MDINATLLGQAITFAILVVFTMKFVWPPLNNMLEERANRIANGLAAAEKGRKELLDAESRVAEELKHVQVRATEIMQNAQKRADQIVEEAKDRAAKEGEKILANAKAEIEQEFVRAKEKLRYQVSVLALEGAKQILKAEINHAQHEAMLANIMAEL